MKGGENIEEVVDRLLKSDSRYVVVDKDRDSKVIYDLESMGIDGNLNGGHEEERFEEAIGVPREVRNNEHAVEVEMEGLVAWEVEFKVLGGNLNLAFALVALVWLLGLVDLMCVT